MSAVEERRRGGVATPPQQTAGRRREPASLLSPGHSPTANTRRRKNVSLIVAHRLQHWASIGLSVDWS